MNEGAGRNQRRAIRLTYGFAGGRRWKNKRKKKETERDAEPVPTTAPSRNMASARHNLRMTFNCLFTLPSQIVEFPKRLTTIPPSALPFTHHKCCVTVTWRGERGIRQHGDDL
ncbi:MAG: hypothetical protein RO009_02850 [Pseudorhodoplanes sp.]|nr:hypothetical protein [Pseudorhodoplanes sp.]